MEAFASTILMGRSMRWSELCIICIYASAKAIAMLRALVYKKVICFGKKGIKKVGVGWRSLFRGFIVAVCCFCETRGADRNERRLLVSMINAFGGGFGRGLGGKIDYVFSSTLHGPPALSLLMPDSLLGKGQAPNRISFLFNKCWLKIGIWANYIQNVSSSVMASIKWKVSIFIKSRY